MKKSKFMNMFILLGLMSYLVTPVNTHAEVNATECANGMEYNYELNRCILSSETVEAKSKANNCSELTGDAYKDCFKANVDEKLVDKETSGDINKASDPKKSYLVPMLVSLGAGYVLVKSEDFLGTCSSTSVWLLLGGGATSLIGEYMSQRSYKKDLKKLSDGYKSRMEDKSTDKSENIDIATQNQKVAFEFQIAQEKAKKDAHESRKKTYNYAFALYTAATLAAIYEGTMSATSAGMTEECSMSNSKGSTSYLKKSQFDLVSFLNPEIFGEYYYIENISLSEFSEIIARKVLNTVISSAHAEADLEVVKNAATADQLTIGKEAADGSGMFDSVKKLIKLPVTRAVLGGLLAYNSKKTADHAGELADEANKRIKFLETLEADFTNSGGAGFQYCSAEDRKLISKPSCFCYNEDNSKNTNRGDAVVCQQQWAKAESLGKPTKYGVDYGQNDGGSLKGCVTDGGSDDPECKCLKKVDSRGDDNCFKLSGKLKLGNLGNIQGLKEMMKDTAGLTSGKASTGDLNAKSAENLALKINDKIESLKSDPKLLPTLNKISDLKEKLNRQMGSRIQKGLNSGALSSPFKGNFLTTSDLNNPADLIKKTDDDIKAMDSNMQTGQNLSQSSTKKDDPFDFDLDTSIGGKDIIIDDELASINKKEFNFNDVNSNKEHNLFQIITNRYYQSGLKKIFETNEDTKKDE